MKGCGLKTDLQLMVVDRSRLICVEEVEGLLDFLLLLLREVGALSL